MSTNNAPYIRIANAVCSALGVTISDLVEMVPGGNLGRSPRAVLARWFYYHACVTRGFSGQMASLVMWGPRNPRTSIADGARRIRPAIDGTLGDVSAIAAKRCEQLAFIRVREVLDDIEMRLERCVAEPDTKPAQ